MQIQYFITASAMRPNVRSPSSKARTTRNAACVAASASNARSASTFTIAGWDASGAPNALRRRVCQTASFSSRRIIPATPIIVSIRVQMICSIMNAVPRPSSPRMRAGRWSNSTSLEARQRPPSLSFRRWRRKPGCGRSATKHVMPPGACPSVRNTSNTGCVQNHLCPVSSYQPSPTGSATVVFARRSEPPCFSVITIPACAKRS